MDDSEKYYALALRFLTFRSRSEKEIRDYLLRHSGKLSRERISGEIIDQVICKLKEQKFIDDVLFAKQWIESRNKYRQRGFRVVKMELLRKGITDDIIEEALMMIENVSEREMVLRIVKKRIGKHKGQSRQEIFEKLGAYLLRRGFEYDDVKVAIDEAVRKEYNQ